MARLGLMTLAALFVAVVVNGGARADNYATRLTAAAYDGAMRANVQGDGRVTATLQGNKLTVKGDFMALPSAVTGAGLYSGVGIGVPGPAILSLQVFGQKDGRLEGNFTLNAKQLAAFKRGHVYVQVNSQKAPDGNLWGWLLPAHPFPGAGVPEKGHGFLPQLDVPGNWTEK